jgi:hypothetical protein
LLNVSDVLEEHVSSIFRVEEYAKQETSMKQAKAACFMLVSCFAYSPTLEMEVI